MSEVRIQLVVACALVDADRRVLIAQRPPGKQLAGLWEFPGGKLEPGESVFDGARRELAEELRVTVRTVDEVAELSVADPGSEFVIEFHAAEIDGEPRCIEHTSLAWVTPEQLLTLPLAPSDREFALHLQRERTASRARTLGQAGCPGTSSSPTHSPRQYQPVIAASDGAKLKYSRVGSG